jgi:hypothetical protein
VVCPPTGEDRVDAFVVGLCGRRITSPPSACSCPLLVANWGTPIASVASPPPASAKACSLPPTRGGGGCPLPPGRGVCGRGERHRSANRFHESCCPSRAATRGRSTAILPGAARGYPARPGPTFAPRHLGLTRPGRLGTCARAEQVCRIRRRFREARTASSRRRADDHLCRFRAVDRGQLARPSRSQREPDYQPRQRDERG